MSAPLPILVNRPIEPFYVVGFDPGGTTGWAIAQLSESKTPSEIKLSDIALETGEFGPHAHHEELYAFVQKLPYLSCELVCEPFTYRQFATPEGGVSRGKVELISAEYIGVITLAARQVGMPLYLGFNAGQALRLITNNKLQLMGWLQTPPHPKRHQNDALRQVVKYLIVKKKIHHPLTTSWRNNAD
jgi:hypothetical protein